MISITEMKKSGVRTLLEALPIENPRLSVFSLEIKDAALAYSEGIILGTSLGGRAVPSEGLLRETRFFFFPKGTGGGRSRGRRKINFQQFQSIGVAQNTGEVGGAGIPTLCLLGTGL
jgi:hypothetical protein